MDTTRDQESLRDPNGDAGSATDRIETEAQLDELLTRPSAVLTEAIRSVRSPLVVVGAGGKMGPTLSVLARRAAEAAGHPLEVVAVSRFSDPAAREWLEQRGVRTLSVDLLDAKALEQLPDSGHVLSLIGLKFGTGQNPSLTWAVNTLAPDRICRRYPQARMVVLSTGNVYPLSPVDRGGATEDDSLTPLGEYANAAVGRERIFDHYSRQSGIPMAVLRLYYAVELRYGVLVDIARKVWADEPIELGNGYVTCIWQGDANEMILRSLGLARTPPSVFNLCRPEMFRVRDIAERFGLVYGRTPRLVGSESTHAIVGNAGRICGALGEPRVSLEQMVSWIGHWVANGGRNLGRPTHFETRDGKY